MAHPPAPRITPRESEDEVARLMTLTAADEPPWMVMDGRYRVDRFLGRGAFKQVFLAHDTELERDVAVSFLGRAGGGRLDRHRREIRAMARLGDHPNIVAVYDIGSEDGLAFIVSQYVAGGSLAERVSTVPDHRMPIPEAISAARDVAAALEHAHARGVIHRDVKPSNVLLGEYGTAMLADFGTVISLEDARITAEHSIVGTAPYMSPEQAIGRPVDARSDFYALGVMLFELVTGELPFNGPDLLAFARQHATAPRPRLSDLLPAAPDELDALVARLMATDPGERPQAAGEIRDELSALASDSPRRTRPPARRSGAEFPLPPALAAERQTAFVGRDDALEALRRTWQQTREGNSRVVLVRGNAGIGKTRLCRALALEAHAEGGTVLYGRCEEEALAPYAPFTEALRHYAAHGPKLAPTGAAELARLGWPVNPPRGGRRAVGRALPGLRGRGGARRRPVRARPARGDLRRPALGRRADPADAPPPHPARAERPGDARVHDARRRTDPRPPARACDRGDAARGDRTDARPRGTRRGRDRRAGRRLRPRLRSRRRDRAAAGAHRGEPVLHRGDAPRDALALGAPPRADRHEAVPHRAARDRDAHPPPALRH